MNEDIGTHGDWGGNLNNGLNAGPCYWNGNNSLGNANWNVAARDYLKWRTTSHVSPCFAYREYAASLRRRLLRRCEKYSN